MCNILQKQSKIEKYFITKILISYQNKKGFLAFIILSCLQAGNNNELG